MQNGGDERVRSRAYELWEKEGRPEGKDKEHWSRAEGETPSDVKESAAVADGPVVGKQTKRQTSSRNAGSSSEAKAGAPATGKKTRGKNG